MHIFYSIDQKYLDFLNIYDSNIRSIHYLMDDVNYFGIVHERNEQLYYLPLVPPLFFTGLDGGEELNELLIPVGDSALNVLGAVPISEENIKPLAIDHMISSNDAEIQDMGVRMLELLNIINDSNIGPMITKSIDNLMDVLSKK